MDHGRGLKNRGTLASEAGGPQKLGKLHMGGNFKFLDMGISCRGSGKRALSCYTFSLPIYRKSLNGGPTEVNQAEAKQDDA